MKVSVVSIQPSGNPPSKLIRVRVLFEEKRQYHEQPLAAEGANVEVYVEATDFIAELHLRAISAAKDFLARAAAGEISS